MTRILAAAAAAMLAPALLATAALAQAAPQGASPASPPATPGVPPGYGVSTDAAGARRPPASPEVVAARHAARQACAADVAKLCADVQSGGGRVMQCVRQHRAEVSPGCGAALGALRDARHADKS